MWVSNSLKQMATVALMLLCLVGCGPASPFEQVRVQGKVTYEDGSLIPAEMIILKFEPLAEPLDSKTHPPVGMSYVNVDDGTFDVVTSYKYADGLVRGEHRVLIAATTTSGEQLQLVPEEYVDSNRTPLIVNTAESPFHLQVRKP